MIHYAYTDRAGTISFGVSLRDIPASALLIAKSPEGKRLRDAIGSIAQLDRSQAVMRVPGMATRDHADALVALGKFQMRAERLLADGGY